MQRFRERHSEGVGQIYLFLFVYLGGLALIAFMHFDWNLKSYYVPVFMLAVWHGGILYHLTRIRILVFDSRSRKVWLKNGLYRTVGAVPMTADITFSVQNSSHGIRVILNCKEGSHSKDMIVRKMPVNGRRQSRDSQGVKVMRSLADKLNRRYLAFLQFWRIDSRC